jgi:hypothetical protein
MAKRRRAPELTFQQRVADFLVRVHTYGVLEQSDITDTEHCIAEDQLWAFLNATQADTLKKVKDDYGSDAREEVVRALRKELDHTPLWMILRHGLKVRGLEFRLYYPKPRSAESAAASKHRENRITSTPPTWITTFTATKASSFWKLCPTAARAWAAPPGTATACGRRPIGTCGPTISFTAFTAAC